MAKLVFSNSESHFGVEEEISMATVFWSGFCISVFPVPVSGSVIFSTWLDVGEMLFWNQILHILRNFNVGYIISPLDNAPN